MKLRFAVQVCLVALLALLAQWGVYDRTLVAMDEGHLAAAASWLLDGKLLYRDIHTGIFPGVYLITAGLFSVFGEDLIVTRLAAVVMNVVTATTLFLIANRMVDRPYAWLAPILHLALLIVGFPVLSMFNYSTLSVCFGLIALLFTLRSLEAGRTFDACAVGFFIACAALTKQNFGGLIFIALFGAILWLYRSSALADRGVLEALLPIALSGLALTLCVVAYFAATDTLYALVDNTILSLGSSQVRDFNNPLPPILGAHPEGDGRFIFLYSPPTLFNALIHGEPFVGIPISPMLRSLAIRASYGVPLLTLAAALYSLRGLGEAEDPARARAIRAAVVFACVFAPGIFPSAIWSHLAFVLIPITLLYPLLASTLDDRLAGSGVWRGVVIGFALLAIGMSAALTLSIMGWNGVDPKLERASLRVSEREAGLYGGSVRFIEACAEPGAPIFAAPDIPIIYFLTDHPNPTKYDLTIPGHVNGPLIAGQLERTRTRCIVYNPQMYPEFPPFKLLFPKLAAYIEKNYEWTETIQGGDTKWSGLTRVDR